MATRSSSAWVALNSMRFIAFLPRSNTEEDPFNPGPDRRGASEVGSWLHHGVVSERDDFCFSSSGVCGQKAGRGVNSWCFERVDSFTIAAWFRRRATLA